MKTVQKKFKEKKNGTKYSMLQIVGFELIWLRACFSIETLFCYVYSRPKKLNSVKSLQDEAGIERTTL